jgi:hypothetical protein
MKTMLAESKIKIGDFYFYKRNNYTAAKVFYNEAITSYPESTIAEARPRPAQRGRGQDDRKARCARRQVRHGRSPEEKALLAVRRSGPPC